MKERRSQTRISDCELAMLSWEEQGIRLKQIANVEDLSPRGIGILVDHPLEPGTNVAISYGDGELIGVVRHQSQQGEAFHMGIEFVPGSRNSILHFQPELLIRRE